MSYHSIQRADLLSLRERQDELRLSQKAKMRLEWLIALTESGASISSVCRRYSIARTTLHRWIERFDASNPSSLEEYQLHYIPPTHAHISASHDAASNSVTLDTDRDAPVLSAHHTQKHKKSFTTALLERTLLAISLLVIGWLLAMQQKESSSTAAQLTQDSPPLVSTSDFRTD